MIFNWNFLYSSKSIESMTPTISFEVLFQFVMLTCIHRRHFDVNHAHHSCTSYFIWSNTSSLKDGASSTQRDQRRRELSITIPKGDEWGSGTAEKEEKWEGAPHYRGRQHQSKGGFVGGCWSWERRRQHWTEKRRGESSTKGRSPQQRKGDRWWGKQHHSRDKQLHQKGRERTMQQHPRRTSFFRLSAFSLWTV